MGTAINVTKPANSISPIILINKFIEKGIFFRSPIYQRDFELYNYDDSDYLRDAKNPKSILGLIHKILNPAATIDSLLEFIKEDNAAGFKLRSIRSPIYFEREVRTLNCIYDKFIIESRGFNYIDEKVAGHCVEEITKFFLDNKLYDKLKTHNKYKYTYEHIIQDLIKNDLGGANNE